MAKPNTLSTAMAVMPYRPMAAVAVRSRPDRTKAPPSGSGNGAQTELEQKYLRVRAPADSRHPLLAAGTRKVAPAPPAAWPRGSSYSLHRGTAARARTAREIAPVPPAVWPRGPSARARTAREGLRLPQCVRCKGDCRQRGHHAHRHPLLAEGARQNARPHPPSKLGNGKKDRSRRREQVYLYSPVSDERRRQRRSWASKPRK